MPRFPIPSQFLLAGHETVLTDPTHSRSEEPSLLGEQGL